MVCENLETGEYDSLDAFASDIMLVFKNCIKYWRGRPGQELLVAQGTDLLDRVTALIELKDPTKKKQSLTKIRIPSIAVVAPSAVASGQPTSSTSAGGGASKKKAVVKEETLGALLVVLSLLVLLYYNYWMFSLSSHMGLMMV